MPFRVIETWANAEQDAITVYSWPQLIAYLESYDYKAKRDIVLLTISKVEK